MPGKIVVEVDMGRYKSVELDLGEAERLLREVTSRLGYESGDASETFRIMRNFDAFYETMKKKFKDHIAPNKSMNDMIRGTVIVDRVKLVKEGDKRRIVIVFDRRVPDEVIKEALEMLGYEVEVKKLQIT